MPRLIEGVEYYSTAEVAVTTGVSRQTLWRWRHAGKIPPGHRLRDRQVIFTRTELESITEYASRVEPIPSEAREQLRLFSGEAYR
jgi:excisionase family DNA binding protein